MYPRVFDRRQTPPRRGLALLCPGADPGKAHREDTPNAHQDTPTYIDAAKAILAGEPVPASQRLSKWAAHPRIAAALTEMRSERISVTTADLGAIYSDREDDDPLEAEAVARYNALTPLERVIIDWADAFDDADARNPIIQQELRLAFRRALERMVEMAEEADRG